MRRPFVWLAMGACALLALWLLARPAGVVAQDQPPLPVGVVDMQRVVKEYTALANENEAFRRFIAQLDQDLKARGALRLLTAEEQEEYAQLLREAPEAKPNDRQKMEDRKRELEQKARQADRRLQELSQKPDLTEEEKQELEAMRTAERETQARLEQLQSDYQQQVEERNRTQSERLDQRIRAAISFIAGKRNLPMVADQAAILFGGIDITNEVLEELNKSES